MKDWTKQLLDDISEVDNQCYNDMPLSILIRTDLNDEGQRYFDCTVFKGHGNDGDTIVDVINVESLSELFQELAKNWP